MSVGRWGLVETEMETESASNHRERHRQGNCTRGRTRSRDRWTGSMGRQMSPAFSCLACLAFSSPGHTPPHLLPACPPSCSRSSSSSSSDNQADSSLALSPSSPLPLPLSLLPSFPAIISLVQNEPQRLEPDSCSILEPALGSLGDSGRQG